MAAWMVCRCIKLRLKPGKPDVPAFLFWAAMYGYCMAALVGLDIHAQTPWFMIVGILFAVGTLYVTAAGET